MFGVEYLIRLVSVLIHLAYAIVGSLLFRPAWNCVARNYLAEWLPDRFEAIPYWHFVAFMLVFSLLGEITNKVFPKLVDITNNDTKTS